MADKIVDISDIETNSVIVNNKLIVGFKKEIIFVLLFGSIIFSVCLIIFFKTHQYFSFTLFLIFQILFIKDKYVYYFPVNIPYLNIDSLGIGYKRKFFNWEEIETIQYRIVNPNVRLSGNYIKIGLKNTKTVSIDVNSAAIDSSIEIIAAHIKNYWPQ